MNQVQERSTGIRRTGWGSRCGLLATLSLAGTAFLSPSASAQTNAGNAPPKNRWLLVIETSRAMRPRAAAVQELTSMLVYSGMNGQAQPGDTIGLWTFNKNLSVGQFPLQQWEPASNKKIARGVYEFLGVQKYEKESRLDVVLPYLQRLIKNSQFINVFLISDGQQEIHGTPFDDKINATYRTWRAQQEKAKLPFVTLLRAKAGRVTDYVVDMPPWPLKLPPLPPELEPRKVAAPKPKKPARRVLPPLILSGRKAESPRETPPPESPHTNGSTPIAMPPGLIHSNEPVAAPKSVSPVAPTGAVRTPNAGLSAVSALPSESGTVPPPEGRERPGSAPGPGRSESPPTSRSVESGAPENLAAASAPLAAEATAAPAGKETNLPSPTAMAAPISPTATTPQRPAPGEQSPRPTEVQTAVTLPQESFWSRKSTWISACIVLAVAFASVFVLVRRSRSSSGTSLITRSLERERKGE